jgi:hypothetical protein
MIALVQRFFQHKAAWVIAVALVLFILVALVMQSEPITPAPRPYYGS